MTTMQFSLILWFALWQLTRNSWLHSQESGNITMGASATRAESELMRWLFLIDYKYHPISRGASQLAGQLVYMCENMHCFFLSTCTVWHAFLWSNVREREGNLKNAEMVVDCMSLTESPTSLSPYASHTPRKALKHGDHDRLCHR